MAANGQVTMRPMRGGAGEIAYNSNSSYQNAVFETAKAKLLATLSPVEQKSSPSLVKIADFGCATGKNSLAAMAGAVVPALREALGAKVDVFAFFSDLPSNDFNSLFQLLAEQSSSSALPFFAAGVPGSFYDQLFPHEFLFMASCYNSLHWLSQDPNPHPDAPGPWNPGTVWYRNSKSTEVAAAYAARAATDLEAFLRARANELLPGGLLWIILSASGVDGPELDSDGRRKGRWWINLLDDAWRALEKEGEAPPGGLDKFNLPMYERNLAEISAGIQAVGQFEVKFLELQKVPVPIGETKTRDYEAVTEKLVNVVRAVVDPMVAAAQGDVVVDKIGRKMKEVLVASLEEKGFRDYRGSFAVMALVKK